MWPGISAKCFKYNLYQKAILGHRLSSEPYALLTLIKYGVVMLSCRISPIIPSNYTDDGCPWALTSDWPICLFIMLRIWQRISYNHNTELRHNIIRIIMLTQFDRTPDSWTLRGIYQGRVMNYHRPWGAGGLVNWCMMRLIMTHLYDRVQGFHNPHPAGQEVCQMLTVSRMESVILGGLGASLQNIRNFRSHRAYGTFLRNFHQCWKLIWTRFCFLYR